MKCIKQNTLMSKDNEYEKEKNNRRNCWISKDNSYHQEENFKGKEARNRVNMAIELSFYIDFYYIVVIMEIRHQLKLESRLCHQLSTELTTWYKWKARVHFKLPSREWWKPNFPSTVNHKWQWSALTYWNIPQWHFFHQDTKFHLPSKIMEWTKAKFFIKAFFIKLEIALW